jgi:hypothetical protein
MKKKLEDFINDNRDAFDSYEPKEQVWEAIKTQLPFEKKNKEVATRMIWIKWSAVAAALIIITSSIFYFSHISQKQDNAIAAVTHDNDVPAEYAEEVYHFTMLIELKHTQLKKIEKEQPELYRQFAGDISKLDSNYQALRNELPGHPNQEVLLQTMIENLKWQIDLLNQQLNIIQKINKSKKSINEKISKSA